jgi:excinuclease UvrABC nuclease subunit
MAQTLLFPDPRPLVERLGADFFRTLPERPGVYLMRDAGGQVLYIGKAKNLRRRLGNYRVANPDRMPRRHLRLLRAVALVELEECPDESTALAREAALLKSIKPRFNRAGTWSGPRRFFAWRGRQGHLELTVTETPEPGWRSFGPLGGGSAALRTVLARLLWLRLHRERGFAGLPAGWARGRLGNPAVVHCGECAGEATNKLEALFSSRGAIFIEWIRAQMPPDCAAFERAALETDLEFIVKSFELESDEEQDCQRVADGGMMRA